MKSFTIQEVTADHVYMTVERDDGTTFGKQVPLGELMGSHIPRTEADGSVTLVPIAEASDGMKRAHMMTSLEDIAVAEDARQFGPPSGALLMQKVGEKITARARPKEGIAKA